MTRLSAVLATLLAASQLPADEPAGDGFPLPTGAVHRFGSRQGRHPDGIAGAAVSPDGKLLATAGARTVIIWDVKTLAAKCVLRDQNVRGPYFDSPGGVAFLPDSRHLLVTVAPSEQEFAIDRPAKVVVARVFDVQTGQQTIAITGEIDYATAAWVAAGGKEVAVFARQKVTYFDAKDGKELRAVNLGQAYRGLIAVAPDARLAAFQYRRGNNAFALVDLATGNAVDDVAADRFQRVALSADGTRLAYSTEDRRIRVRDPRKKETLLTFNAPATYGVVALQFSADLQTLYVGGAGGRISRWDLKANKRLPDVGDHSSWNLSGFVLSPDESMLYSTGHDHIVRRWDLKAGKQLPLPAGYVTQTAVAPLADRKTLVVADHAGAIDLWDLGTGKLVKRLQDQEFAGIDTLAVSPDGRWLACGRTTQDVPLWDLKAGKQERVIRLADNGNLHPTDHVKRVAFSADATVLFTSSGETGISAWDTTTGKRRWNAEQLGPWLAADPRGRSVAACSAEDREVPQWVLLDAKTGQVVRRMDVTPVEPNRDALAIEYTPFVTDVLFTPDGARLLTAHEDGTVRIWNPETAHEVGRLTGTGHEQASLALSPNGRWAAVGQSDYKITVWELATEKLLATLVGHDSPVRDVAFTRDGRGIIGNADLAPVFWTLEPRVAPKVNGPPWDVLATADGAKAYELQWALVKDPAAAIKLFSEKVKPAELALARATFDQWVKDLDSPRFRAREAAERDLTRAGMRVPLGWLRQALADAKADEPRARLGRVLAERDGPNPDEWRLLRAVQVLELAGTPEAKELLKAWAAVEGSPVAEPARGAVGRLTK